LKQPYQTFLYFPQGLHIPKFGMKSKILELPISVAMEPREEEALVRLDLRKFIKKYRYLILENLYSSNGYEYQGVHHFEDDQAERLLIVYVKQKKPKQG